QVDASQTTSDSELVACRAALPLLCPSMNPRLFPPCSHPRTGRSLRAASMKFMVVAVLLECGLAGAVLAQSLDAKQTATYRRLRAELDAIPAIDTHDHPMPYDRVRGRVETERGFGMTLHSLWQQSYYTWFNPLTAWPASGKFEDWWPKAKKDFDNARATSFYTYQLPAFRDLYGVDFDRLTD